MEQVSVDVFSKLDIRCGTIIKAELNSTLKKPAYRLEIDFGEEIGIKKTSAQLTENYGEDQLIQKQVLAVVNFPPKQIGHFMSEVLVLALLNSEGKNAILIVPDKPLENGFKLF